MIETTPTTSSPSKPRIRILGATRYLVESKTRPGLGHQVDVLHLRCSCEAGKRGLRCWHLALAISYDAWRKKERERARVAARTRRNKPVPAPVPATPALEPVAGGSWHDAAAGDGHASAETGMRALQVAFE